MFRKKSGLHLENFIPILLLGFSSQWVGLNAVIVCIPKAILCSEFPMQMKIPPQYSFLSIELTRSLSTSFEISICNSVINISFLLSCDSGFCSSFLSIFGTSHIERKANAAKNPKRGRSSSPSHPVFLIPFK